MKYRFITIFDSTWKWYMKVLLTQSWTWLCVLTTLFLVLLVYLHIVTHMNLDQVHLVWDLSTQQYCFESLSSINLSNTLQSLWFLEDISTPTIFSLSTLIATNHWRLFRPVIGREIYYVLYGTLVSKKCWSSQRIFVLEKRDLQNDWHNMCGFSDCIMCTGHVAWGFS